MLSTQKLRLSVERASGWVCCCTHDRSSRCSAHKRANLHLLIAATSSQRQQSEVTSFFIVCDALSTNFL